MTEEHRCSAAPQMIPRTRCEYKPTFRLTHREETTADLGGVNIAQQMRPHQRKKVPVSGEEVRLGKDDVPAETQRTLGVTTTDQ